MPDNVQNSSNDTYTDDGGKHTLLDVEDDHDRERRIRRLLRKTDNSTLKGTASSEPRTDSNASGSSSIFDFGIIHETHQELPSPPTQLLDRLRAFLPQIEADNAALLHRAQANPESVDIEHLDHAADHPDAQYIEMNLGLGVFTMRRTGSEAGSSSSSSSQSEDDDDINTNPADVASSTESDSDSSDSSDDSNSSSSSSSSDSSSDSDSNSSDGSPPLPLRLAQPSHSADHGTETGTETGASPSLLLPGVDAHPRRPMRPLPTKSRAAAPTPPAVARSRPSIVVLGETISETDSTGSHA